MSDDKLADAVARGHQAVALLSSPLMTEMFDRYEANCIKEWKATDPLDTAAREAFWHSVTAASKVREALRHVAAAGRMAQGDIDRLNAGKPA